MPSAQELMDLIRKHYGDLDPDDELPVLPTKVLPFSSLPQTPPEALARLEAAKAEGAKLQAIVDELSRFKEMKAELILPLVELYDSIYKRNKELEKENEALRAELAELKSQSKTATP
jgi:DNA repair exonuclease SbcCD ATPase subunit